MAFLVIMKLFYIILSIYIYTEDFPDKVKCTCLAI